MKHHQREIHRHPESCREFLFSKADIAEDSTTCSPDAAVAIDLLKGRFPDVLCDRDLLQAAMSALETVERFGAMAIRIDNAKDLVMPEAAMQDAAEVLDTICSESGGIWGVLDRYILGCFWPEKEEADCLVLAETFQQQLALRREDTVSIGLSMYPTICYRKTDILENARKALDHADFFGPGSFVSFDSVSLNISGDKFYQGGDMDRAVSEFNLALQLDPENVNVHNSLGVCYGVMGDLDQALSAFEKAIQLDPDEIMALYNAGYIHMLKKSYEKALEYFTSANRIDGNVYELAFQTGQVLLETGKPETAKKYLETAVSLNEKSGAAHRLLGDCYAAIDRISDALGAYKTALKLRPDDSAALSALGYLYEMQGQNAEIALIFCRKATEMSPENGQFYHRLGRVYHNRSMLEEALSAFEKAQLLGYESTEYIGKIKKEHHASDAKNRTAYS